MALKRNKKKRELREKLALRAKRLKPLDPKAEQRRKKALAAYDSHLTKTYELLLTAVLRAVATAQAVSDVNQALEVRFGMEGVSIDASRMQTTALEIMQAEIAEGLTRSAKMSVRARRELVDRVVARLIPKRDGAPSPSAFPTRVSRDDRVADLEHLIRREMKRAYEPRGSQSTRREVKKIDE